MRGERIEPLFSNKAVLEMDRAVQCLGLELPGPVWDDVRARWLRVLDAIKEHDDAK